MKLITDRQCEAIRKCLDYNIPFALFALPGEKECRFFASLPDNDGENHAFTGDDPSADRDDTFFISFFNGDEPYMAGVHPSLNEEDIISGDFHNETFPAPGILPYRVSTRRRTYSEAFNHMKQRLRAHGGKVVLSRHEALFSPRPLLKVVDEYLSGSSGTFRYLCQTPETGIWFGVTPELLIEADAEGTSFLTMALAGTMPMGVTLDWDEKNIHEHAFVAQYISQALDEIGLKVTLEDTEEINAGAVRHLRTVITASGHADPFEVAGTLNPTPAVAGIPKDIAIAEIDTYENHRRRCYAGMIGVRIDGRLRAFVNLRCAFTACAILDGKEGWLYNLYAGGGLMPDSDEEAEWQETEEKLSVLRSVILKRVRCGEDTDLRDVTFCNKQIDLPF